MRHPPKSILPFVAGLVTGVLAVLLVPRGPQANEVGIHRFAPAFLSQGPEDWINSGPLSWERLRGRVVLLQVTHHGCDECKASLPWLRSLQERYRSRGLTVIGVHTPETGVERVEVLVKNRVSKYAVEFPVMLDRNGRYATLLDVQDWPSTYLVGKRGLIRASYSGETLDGDGNASAIEADIERLLAE